MSRFAPHTLIAKPVKYANLAKHATVATLLVGLTSFSMLAAAQPAVTASEPAAQSVATSAAPAPMAGVHDPAKMQAWRAKRMAGFKARLKITPEQEANWAAFAAGVAPPAMTATMGADQRAAAMQRPNWAELEKLSTPERLDKLRALREAREGRFKAARAKREDATKTFYATLQPEQKTVFDAAMMRMLQRRLGGHGEHGGGHGGYRGRMGDAGEQGGQGDHGDLVRPGRG
jgi:hypothetical protein